MARYILNSGRLNRKIGIYEYQDTVDEYGRSKQILALIRTVWAEVKPQRGYEYLESYKEKGKLTTKVTIRYTEGIHDGLVLKFNDSFHEITGIIDVNDEHRVLEIMTMDRLAEDKEVGE